MIMINIVCNTTFFTYKIFNSITNFIKQSIILFLPSRAIINPSILWKLIRNGFGPVGVL